MPVECRSTQLLKAGDLVLVPCPPDPHDEQSSPQLGSGSLNDPDAVWSNDHFAKAMRKTHPLNTQFVTVAKQIVLFHADATEDGKESNVCVT